MSDGMLSLDPVVVAVIVAMALATIIAKVGGLWLLSKIEVSDRLKAGLSVLPGAIVIAILGPELVSEGPAEWAGAGVTVLVMWKTENILLTLCVGVGAVALFRLLL
jgi:uncharacterized membrane protein